jgi:hypothetical protein
MAQQFIAVCQDGFRTISGIDPSIIFHSIDDARYAVEMPINPEAPEVGRLHIRYALVPHHMPNSGYGEIAAEATYTIDSREHFRRKFDSFPSEHISERSYAEITDFDKVVRTMNEDLRSERFEIVRKALQQFRNGSC